MLIKGCRRKRVLGPVPSKYSDKRRSGSQMIPTKPTGGGHCAPLRTDFITNPDDILTSGLDGRTASPTSPEPDATEGERRTMDPGDDLGKL
ncbi:MAG: hypothetical protein EOP64_13535 [Sphingomonas sp.]|jgi:hypothetical protein|nr:MAG: hypothetical protein EOP64_13535 [Sphingomonas sp.]